MRKFAFLIILTLILASKAEPSFIHTEAKTMNGFSCTYTSNIVDPVDPKPKITISGRVDIINGPSKNKLRIRYELYSDSKFGMDMNYANGYASSLFTYPKVESIEYSFVIDDQYNYVSRNIVVRLGVYDVGSRTYVNYIEDTLYPKKKETINIDDISGDLTYDNFLCISDNQPVERFNFSNFSKIVEIEYYYRLDLSSLSFRYSSHKPFSYKKAYLTFDDPFRIFPDIIEIDRKKTVDLYPYQENNDIHFGFKNLFVEPLTLKMASTSKIGYQKTDYFFLPKNQISQLQGLNLTINMEDVGINEVSFGYSFSINISSLLLGPCDESKYCIVGGIKR